MFVQKLTLSADMIQASQFQYFVLKQIIFQENDVNF
jgi:hypothetical protein